MIKKGIILAGGMGTRMSPLTKAVNKHLLPIYDKPLIFYPFSILMLSKIRDILIIVNKGQLDQYKKIIPNGLNLGIKISYLEQKFPRGLPEAFLIGEKFINKNNVALILGDNFFYGQNLTEQLIKCTKLKNGAKVFLHKVLKPELYGVAKLNKANKIISIKEKPKKYLSEIEAIVLPSEKEGFGRVLIEGMAQGCVAIGTRTGGIKDIIVDGENGFFLEEVSSDEIKKKVLTLFGDSDLLNKYRENSYEYIRERFSPEQYKAKIISIYREIT